MTDEFNIDKLNLIGQGHAAFQLLYAGTQFNVFATLSEHPGLSQEELGKRLQLAAAPTYILLTGLVALGVLTKTGNAYANSAIAEKHLVPGKEDYRGGILGWQAHIVYPGLMDFIPSLRANTNLGLARFPGEGKTLYERLASQPQLEKIFQDSMSGLSKQANRHLLDAVDFSQFQQVVDAGGGDGTNAIAINRRYPSVKVTVFDRPTVCAIAERNIRNQNLEGRVFTHSGNFFADAFPAGTDAVLLCHIVTIWSAERNEFLFKHVYNALPQGGAIVIFSMMANDDGTGPISTALGSPYFLTIATGEGMLHPWKTYERALKNAGFRSFQRIEGLPLDHGVLIARK